MFGLSNLLVSRVYDCSSSNRTSMPFNDLQGILNAQFHTVSDLLTIVFLSENSVIQQAHMLVFRPDRSHEVGLSSDLKF